MTKTARWCWVIWRRPSRHARPRHVAVGRIRSANSEFVSPFVPAKAGTRTPTLPSPASGGRNNGRGDSRLRGNERSSVAQLRIAHSFDPVGASRSRGNEHAVLSAKAALDLGAREQRG